MAARGRVEFFLDAVQHQNFPQATQRSKIDFQERKIDIFALFTLQRARTGGYRSRPIKCIAYCIADLFQLLQNSAFSLAERAQFDLKNSSSVRNFQTYQSG